MILFRGLYIKSVQNVGMSKFNQTLNLESIIIRVDLDTCVNCTNLFRIRFKTKLHSKFTKYKTFVAFISKKVEERLYFNKLTNVPKRKCL